MFFFIECPSNLFYTHWLRVRTLTLLFISPAHRRMFGLRENMTSGEWEHMELCMGDEETCTGDLVGANRQRFILSFGEDEEGELYVLTSATVSAIEYTGVVYRIVDPSR